MGKFRIVAAAVAVAAASVSSAGAVGVVTAGTASATTPTCNDSWTGGAGDGQWTSPNNWSAGIPGSSSDVCITLAGTYTVTMPNGATVDSFDLGGSSGTQTLVVDNTNAHLTIAEPSVVNAHGKLVLGDSTDGGYASLVGGATEVVTNNGSISSTGTQAYLETSIVNNKTISLAAANNNEDTYTGSVTLTNNAAAAVLTVGSGATYTVSGGSDFTNTAGTVADNGTMSQSGGTFTEGAGSETGNAIQLGSVTFTDATTSGAGNFAFNGDSTLTGGSAAGIPTGQTVTVLNDGVHLYVAVNVVNDGTFNLGGGGGGNYASLVDNTSSGGQTFTNDGTFNTTGVESYFENDIVNNGTMSIGATNTYQDNYAGPVTLANDSAKAVLTVVSGANYAISGGSSFTNTAGTVADNGTMSQSGGTFTEGAGSETGNAIQLGSVTFTDATTSGAGNFAFNGDSTLTGGSAAGIPTGQTVTVLNDGVHLYVAVNVVNDGTFNLGGGGGGNYASLVDNTSSGGQTFTNDGTFNTTGVESYFENDIVNNGTMSIGATTTNQDNYAGAVTLVNNGTIVVADNAQYNITGGSTLTETASGDLTVTNDVTAQTESHVSGVIALDGTLSVTTIGSPAVGSTFTPISGSTITGSFTGEEYGPYGYTLAVNATSVTVTATSIPFSVTSASFSPAALEPTTYTVATITTLLGSPTYTATINWGDSTTSAGTVTGSSVTGYHSFATPGKYTVTVTVQGSDGTELSSSKVITVRTDPVPTVTAVSPTVLVQGAVNKVLTITGTGMATNATASFSAAGITVVSSTYNSPTKMTVEVDVATSTPAGAGNVTITTNGGSGTCTGCLTIDALPTITSVQPGPAPGATTTVTVTGSGFQSGLRVSTTIPGATLGSVSNQSATSFQIPVTVPAGTARATYRLTVTNPDGGKVTGNVIVPPLPTVTKAAPNPVLQSTTDKTLTVNGTGFDATSVASFSASGVSVVSTTYDTAGKLTVVVNIAANATLGAGNVIVTTDGGTGTCTGCLTIDARPTITSVTPAPAPGATTTLTVTGTGFQSGLVVTSTVPGATFGSVSGQSATTFQVPITVPAGTSAGSYTLTVTNPDNGKANKTITVS